MQGYKSDNYFIEFTIIIYQYIERLDFYFQWAAEFIIEIYLVKFKFIYIFEDVLPRIQGYKSDNYFIEFKIVVILK